MPKRRAYLMSVHTAYRPAAVSRNGQVLAEHGSLESLVGNSGLCGWYYDEQQQIAWVKATTGWRYGADSRGPLKDPEQDTAYWDDAAAGENAGYQIRIALTTHTPSTQAAASVYGPPARLKMEINRAPILADGHSNTTVQVSMLDKSGNRVMNAGQAVQLSIDGNGALDCGAATCAVSLKEGMLEAKVTSTTVPGQVRIHARAEGFEPAEARVEAVRGTFRLQASPPARIHLISGSWLKYRVNIYATIESNGKIVRSATNPVHLHITGPAGSTPPADREVNAIKGIATFNDIGFEPPAKYVFHVSSEGVEPADIPIY
jgi:hypothetical protein